jgi:hypothetical protein
MPLSKPTVTFLRATAGNANGSAVSFLVTDVPLLDRSMTPVPNQNHPVNRGFPSHPPPKIRICMNKTG